MGEVQDLEGGGRSMARGGELDIRRRGGDNEERGEVGSRLERERGEGEERGGVRENE